MKEKEMNENGPKFLTAERNNNRDLNEGNVTLQNIDKRRKTF